MLPHTVVIPLTITITLLPIVIAVFLARRTKASVNNDPVMARIEAPLASAILDHLHDQGSAGSSVFAVAQVLATHQVVKPFGTTERLEKIRLELEWLAEQHIVACVQRNDNPNLSVYAYIEDPEP